MAGADEPMANLAFQYGRNVGLAFQLVDDLLDFVSSAEAMGKPTAADLKLGLATAPVLFACEKVNYSSSIFLLCSLAFDVRLRKMSLFDFLIKYLLSRVQYQK